MTDQEVANQIDRIYARIPHVNCKGRCQAACSAIVCFDVEWKRTGLADDAPDWKRCPGLTPSGKCSAYAVRPAICRLWGAVKKMRCPHGCRPKRWLSDQEAHEILESIRQISSKFAGPGLRLLELAQGLADDKDGHAEFRRLLEKRARSHGEEKRQGRREEALLTRSRTDDEANSGSS